MSPKDPIKVYDARWEVAEFDDVAVRRLFEATFGYARLLDVDTITLARDARLGGGRVMEIGVATAMRMGFRVFLRPEPISTPQSYFTTLWVSQKHPKTMGLTVTASHNPAQYIGVKFTVPTVAAIGQDCGPMDGLTKVRELYHNGEVFEDRAGGSLELLDLTWEYIDFSMKAAGVKEGDLAGMGVVLDTFHGSAGPEIYRALRKAGARVEALRLIPNGEFPTGSPNPTSQGKMDEAVKLAERTDCAAVIGIDGDGDRIVFGDRRGILTAGFAFVPILRECLVGMEGGAGSGRRAAGSEDGAGSGQRAVGREEGAGSGRRAAGREEGVGGEIPKALYDPKVSPLALAEWGKLGALPVLFRNGHSQIKDYMKQIGALAAAEESGHYYHRITMGDLTIAGENSTMTVLLFLGALAKQRDLLDQLWAMERQIFTTGEFNYQFANDDVRDEALSAVIGDCVADGAKTVTATPDGIDLQGTCLFKGVRLEPGNVKLEEGWISGYLRVATNEKGVVRGYFSAGDTATGRAVEKRAREILEKRYGGVVIE